VKDFWSNITRYRFEFRHLTVLFAVLVIFQFILSFIQKSSLQEFIVETQNWYQQYSAEKIANLTSTSLELIFANIDDSELENPDESQTLIQSFNIIFSQQLLQQNVDDICLLVKNSGSIYAIDDGEVLFDYITHHSDFSSVNNPKHEFAVNTYTEFNDSIRISEQVFTLLEGTQTFHVFVPFVPNGEYQGVIYMRITPDFTNITREIISSYDEAAIIYSSIIMLGLLAMYYISSFSVKERDESQRILAVEKEKYIKEQIIHEKESIFTQRIYHTHHKAEKVMGFIKEDLRKLSGEENIEIKKRMMKYSNFISRVIYDMKWYDPPIQTIRGQSFNTDLNELIKFIVDHIFLRLSTATEIYNFELDLDDSLPKIPINEFVAWEVIEPLIQNSIDHAKSDKVIIEINTNYDKSNNQIVLKISDNGRGIDAELLEEVNGIKRIFFESTSTKIVENKNSGYGCYLAYQIATKRCGWQLDVNNNEDKGCSFTIIIPSQNPENA
jgi:hypothetical protein